jgi:hypothetical protein
MRSERSGVVVVIDQECLGYARECERLARMANDQELQQYLFDLAGKWMALALGEEKMPEPEAAPPH